MNNTYAQILFDVVNDKDECAYSLLLVKEIFDEQVMKFFTAQVINKEEKKALIEEMTILTPSVINFLKVLVDDQQIGKIHQIIDDYRDIYLAHNQVMPINITVAHQLDNNVFNNLVKSLSEKLNKNVVINTIIDPSVIGGIKINYTDKVVDNTILHQLQQLEKSIRKEVL